VQLARRTCRIGLYKSLIYIDFMKDKKLAHSLQYIYQERLEASAYKIDSHLGGKGASE
jgi:hypothetical protein